MDSVNTIVKNIIELQPVYAENNTKEVETFLQNACPSNCTGRGNCTKQGMYLL